MANNYLEVNGNLGEIREYRDIKITSKRQLTIPKAFFDHLQIDETVHAYLLDDGIIIKPAKKKTVQEEDIEAIVRNVLKEGYVGDDLANEIAHRIKKYNELLDRRIAQFENDMASDAVSEDNEGDDLNGLDIFFDTKDGTDSEKS
ncbi:AbrB/MazE/SpoVT family DNA-binding domain-containing protein [Priestia aryabhattai]|uniref:AbrB/MazE/SpoVT family DNA-binding domain-containing protein n=1 Tax=Priestia aryabhattai TaxID=412384 RepID=UPI003D299A2B